MPRKKKGQSGLNIPDAPFRPGEESSFASWPWKPEDLGRPDPAKCSADDTVPHAHGLVRVLGDDGTASGEWNPNLSPEELRDLMAFLASCVE